MSISSKFKIQFLIIFFLIIQSIESINVNNVIKFNDLYGLDLKCRNTSFQKYSNKLVLLYQMSPILHHPEKEVKCLNSIYDQYNARGLEIGESSK